MTERLDQRMVVEGYAASRTKAQALIAAGVVRVGGSVANKAGARAVGPIEVVTDPCPWVSRAALKLLHAIDSFELVPSGIALDIGASTGGFTEVLLARGAAHVHALDVGHGQLHPRLVEDPRVSNHEGVNARVISPGQYPAADWITIDLSFISLGKVLPAVLSMGREGAQLVALIKPQFEAGRTHIGKGGIVSDPEVQQRVVQDTSELIARLGWQVAHETESPIQGGDGNREFLVVARNGA